MKPTHDMKAPELVELVCRLVTLEERGGLLVGRCAFHEGDDHELVVDGEKGTWRCAACGPESADVVGWVMKSEGVTRAHAAELVREGALLRKTGRRRGPLKGAVPKLSSIRKLRAPFEATDSDAEIVEKVVGYYAEELEKSEEALEYLERRKLERRVVNAFRLGFANRTLGLRLPAGNRLTGRELRQRLTSLGLLRESGHEQLRGAIVVPLEDASGAVVNLYGRKIDKRYGGEHFWMDASRKGLFNAKSLVGAKEIVIAGSVLDALTIWNAGITQVTALHGADGPRAELVEAVIRSGAERVTLALRRTPEMSEAAKLLVSELAPAGVVVLAAVLPQGADVNDIGREEDGAFKIGRLLRLAEWQGGTARSPSPASTATPMDPLPIAAAAANEPDESAALIYRFLDRRWRIRGLDENRARGVLKVNVFVSREGVGFHVDSFDLYSSRHRTAFLRQGAGELGMDEAALKKDLGQVLLALEDAQERMLEKLREPEAKAGEMSDAERARALELLRDPKLLERVLESLAAMGIVGERENLLTGYLVALSRKLAHPLALVIQSSSAAGKTALSDAILSTVPPEDRVSYAAVTGQSLYYMRRGSLKHRVLSIAEEARGEKATQALKLLQSSKELVIASTGKDPASGKIRSHEYKVEGPVALMVTTTKVELDEELLSRSLVVTIDESPAQTMAVQEAQRRAQTLEGIVLEERRAELELVHQNAQRLLRPVVVVNPFAGRIEYRDRRVRARRDHRKLLSLIETIALAHQHQRPVKRHELAGERVIEYIEATSADVELAERLMAASGAATADELPPRTRELLGALWAFLERRGRERGTRIFSRREVREALGCGDTQLKTHLKRLVDSELVTVHRAERGLGAVYELAFDATSVTAAERSGAGRASVGPRSGLGRPPLPNEIAREAKDETTSVSEERENAVGVHKTRSVVGVSRAS